METEFGTLAEQGGGMGDTRVQWWWARLRSLLDKAIRGAHSHRVSYIGSARGPGGRAASRGEAWASLVVAMMRLFDMAFIDHLVDIFSEGVLL